MHREGASLSHRVARFWAQMPGGDEAARLRAMFLCCPHAHEIDTVKGTHHVVEILFCVPVQKTWWVDVLCEEPQLIGALEAGVEWCDDSLIDKGAVPPHGPVNQKPPCGSECPTCPRYRTKCQGCPVSLFYDEGCHLTTDGR